MFHQVSTVKTIKIVCGLCHNFM